MKDTSNSIYTKDMQRKFDLMRKWIYIEEQTKLFFSRQCRPIL